MATTNPQPPSHPHTPLIIPPPSSQSPSSNPLPSHHIGTDLSSNVAMEAGSDEKHLFASHPKEVPTKPWCSLLKSLPPSAGSVNLQFVEPKYSSTENILEIDEEILKEGAKDWEQKIVGFFLDKKLPFSIVKENVMKKWKLSGTVDIALDGEMFYFSFSNDEDREKVVDEGSFHMMGKVFVVRPWTREIEENRGAIRSIPLWVKLFNVPKHLWTPKGFSSLLSSLGHPLFMDKITEKQQMLTFARVCVEVNAEKLLPTELKVRINTKKVVSIPLEYQWKPMVCTKCQVFGHTLNNCERHKVEKNKADVKGKGVQNPWKTKMGGAGPSNGQNDKVENQNMQWKVIKKPAQTTLAAVQTITMPSLTNRFATLTEEEDEVQVNREKGEVEKEATTLNENIETNLEEPKEGENQVNDAISVIPDTVTHSDDERRHLTTGQDSEPRVVIALASHDNTVTNSSNLLLPTNGDEGSAITEGPIFPQYLAHLSPSERNAFLIPLDDAPLMITNGEDFTYYDEEGSEEEEEVRCCSWGGSDSEITVRAKKSVPPLAVRTRSMSYGVASSKKLRRYCKDC